MPDNENTTDRLARESVCEQRERILVLEKWTASHDGRIDELWRQRLRQDDLDRRSFESLTKIVRDLRLECRLIKQKVVLISAVAVFCATLASHFLLRNFAK